MTAARFRVYIRDRPNALFKMPLLGEVDVYTSFEAVARYNSIGSWTMSLPAGEAQAELIRPGRGVVVYLASDRTRPVFSGPITGIERSWSVDNAGAGQLIVTGKCDNAILLERIARGTPRRPFEREGNAIAEPYFPHLNWEPLFTPYGASERAPVSTAEWIWALCHENLCMNHPEVALDTPRRIPYVHVTREAPASISAVPADNIWRGFQVRMSDLAEMVFAAATAAGLNVRFLWGEEAPSGQVSAYTQGVFLHVDEINDRSNEVVFDPAAGNLSAFSFKVKAPEATRVVLAGSRVSGNQRYYEARKNSLFNPSGWKDWNSVDSLGNLLYPAQWSDPNWGRTAIEVEWNTTAEALVEATETEWKWQPDPFTRFASQAPGPGTDARARFDANAVKALVEKGPKGLLTLEVLDAPGSRFGADYGLGDAVRCLVDTSIMPPSMLETDGVIREQVREVAISSAASEIWKVRPTVGTPDSSETPYIYRELRKLRSRVEAENQADDQSEAEISMAPQIRFAPAGSPEFQGSSSGAAETQRPHPGQTYQIQVVIPVVWPQYIGVHIDRADVTLEYSTDGYSWTTIPDSSIKTVSSLGFWYYNHALGGANDYRYYRARVARSGATSPYCPDVVKVTCTNGTLNASGSLTVNPVSGTYRKGTRVNVGGTDTTYGNLRLQYSTDLSNWNTVYPHFRFNNTAWSTYLDIPYSGDFHLRAYSVNGSGNAFKFSDPVLVSATS